jgi:hypothetical protein
LEAEVILPLPSTEITGTCVALPNEPVLAFTVARVVLADPADVVTSPVKAGRRAEDSVPVKSEALPVVATVAKLGLLETPVQVKLDASAFPANRVVTSLALALAAKAVVTSLVFALAANAVVTSLALALAERLASSPVISERLVTGIRLQ